VRDLEILCMVVIKPAKISVIDDKRAMVESQTSFLRTEIQKILYTTDLSENSGYAFRYAMNSAQKHDAKIYILHVLEKLPSMAHALVDSQLGHDHHKSIVEETVARTVDRIKNRLTLFCERELKDDPGCADRVASIEVCEGYPADEILKKVDQLDCDVIVMGTHGKGGLGQALLGSMAERVLRHTRKPVFIIPLPKGETDITFHDM
jgi:nucleotide-binding universal stress UspA family protein